MFYPSGSASGRVYENGQTLEEIEKYLLRQLGASGDSAQVSCVHWAQSNLKNKDSNTQAKWKSYLKGCCCCCARAGPRRRKTGQRFGPKQLQGARRRGLALYQVLYSMVNNIFLSSLVEKNILFLLKESRMKYLLEKKVRPLQNTCANMVGHLTTI